MIKDGKLFGKINLFDFAILVLLVLLILVGLIKFSTFNKSVDASKMGKIVYTLIISDVRDYTANSFKSGDAVFDSGTDINIGIIKDVIIKPAKVENNLADGSTKLIENPYKNDVILTVETPGSMSDLGYFANKSIELKVGSEKKIDTLYSMTTAKVGSILYEE